MATLYQDKLRERGLSLAHDLQQQGYKTALIEDSFRDYMVKLQIAAQDGSDAGKLNLYYSPKRKEFTLKTHEMKNKKLAQELESLWHELNNTTPAADINLPTKGYVAFVDGARGRPVQPRWLGARRRGAAGGATSAWGGVAVVRGAAGEAGAPPRYCSAGRRGELLRRAPALRGWQRCARLPASSEVRCVACCAAASSPAFLLVSYTTLVIETGAFAIFEYIARHRGAKPSWAVEDRHRTATEATAA